MAAVAGAKRPETRSTEIGDKVENILQELRVVIPGTEAMLGFQFVAVFSNQFGSIPRWAKDLHLVSLLCMCVSIMLLMFPAAYHRIAEEGQDSRGFHVLASRVMLAAMAALAVGLTADLLVVFQVTTGQLWLGIAVMICVLASFILCWFAFPAYKRGRSRKERVLRSLTDGQ